MPRDGELRYKGRLCLRIHMCMHRRPFFPEKIQSFSRVIYARHSNAHSSYQVQCQYMSRLPIEYSSESLSIKKFKSKVVECMYDTTNYEFTHTMLTVTEGTIAAEECRGIVADTEHCRDTIYYAYSQWSQLMNALSLL